ncbi:hypothetical protein BVC80_1667g77 [Macleaya cordata]|uniref:Uncharacterized protein n=1 Tax=Macleaya cordata TaxID=56857 RepID=A0A200RBE8_MACCD|nr:hypothetical protein BVC80_1667g77 [Macleaya cordata]
MALPGATRVLELEVHPLPRSHWRYCCWPFSGFGGMEWAAENGWSDVWVVSDSLTATRVFKMDRIP